MNDILFYDKGSEKEMKRRKKMPTNEGTLTLEDFSDFNSKSSQEKKDLKDLYSQISDKFHQECSDENEFYETLERVGIIPDNRS